MVWGCLSITLFLVLLFHGSGLHRFRSFHEEGKRRVFTKRHNSSFIELEFENAAWSSLDFFGEKKKGMNRIIVLVRVIEPENGMETELHSNRRE